MSDRTRRGMTLIEVLFVLLLVTGAAFFVLIKVPIDWQEQRLNAAASRLVDDLRELQQAALAESRAYRVTFSYTDGCYTLEALTDTSTRQTIYLEAGVSFLGAPEDIIFYGNGILGKGSQAMPLVCGSHERRVIIAPNFGRIRQERV